MQYRNAPPAFEHAVQFLHQAHGNLISEDLVEWYCRRGLLKDIEGRLALTAEGLARLERTGHRHAQYVVADC